MELSRADDSFTCSPVVMSCVVARRCVCVGHIDGHAHVMEAMLLAPMIPKRVFVPASLFRERFAGWNIPGSLSYYLPVDATCGLASLIVPSYPVAICCSSSTPEGFKLNGLLVAEEQLA